jgi:uncharacterized protein (TIGR03435 family)
MARWIAFVALAVAAAAATPKFEVASIRPCEAGASAPAGGGRSENLEDSSLGTYNSGCQTVKNHILMAYAGYADGRAHPPPLAPIEGGPGWIDSVRYRIVAKPEGGPSFGMMKGPMMQALLEDRFHLKIRRETREVPAFALTVAKNGVKLKPFQQGSCVDIGVVAPLTKAPPHAEPGQMPILCGVNSAARNPPNVTWDLRGTTLDFFAKTLLSTAADRPVLNQTGLTGLFDIHLEFAPETAAPADDPAGGPSIFTAVQEQLGLKLEPSKAPKEFLVIESVERPSEN